VAFGPAAVGKVRARAHFAAAEGGLGHAAAEGDVAHGPAAGGGGGMGHAAAVVVHSLIRTSAYIARAAGAAVRKANSGALAASVVRLAGG
jgi:hypothetical protein